FIPVSTTCYDDPTKDHSGPAISTVVPDSDELVISQEIPGHASNDDCEVISNYSHSYGFKLNQPIAYLDPRPEYIRVIIEWSTKSSIPMARIVSPYN
ncbi:unnamed protein product, partial [Rotaria magnacalcarata]